METTAVENSVDYAGEVVVVCGGSASEGSCCHSKEDHNSVSGSEEFVEEKPSIHNQPISQRGIKRSYTEDVPVVPEKKQRTIPMVTQKLFPVVKIERSPAIDELALNCSKSASSSVWQGWRHPNPTYRRTQSIIQALIGEAEHVCRGKIATKQWQVRAEQHIAKTYIMQNKSPVESTEKVLNKPGSSEEINQKTSEECGQDTTGFCGFDLSMQVGNFRGWEKPKTRARDELKRKVAELEASMTLTSELEEADHVVWSNCKESVDKSFLNKTLSRQLDKEEDVNSRIDQYLKEIMESVADRPMLEPPYSYMVLAVVALKSSPETRLALDDIVRFIKDQFPYYQTVNDSWVKALDHTVHWNDMFISHASCWTVDSLMAEAILSRTVDRQRRKAVGCLQFVNNSLPSISSNEKHNISIMDIVHTSTSKQHQYSKKNNKLTMDKMPDLPPIKVKRMKIDENKVIKKLKKKDILHKDLSPIKVKKVKIDEQIVIKKLTKKDILHKKSIDKVHLKLKRINNKESVDQSLINKELSKKSDEVDDVCWRVDREEGLNSRVDQEDVNLRVDKYLKEIMESVADRPMLEPPYSYMVLAVVALKSSPETRLALDDIIRFIKDQFPYYRTANDSWVKALDHTVHWNDMFISHASCWTVDSLMAEAILSRTVDRQRRKVAGNPKFVNKSLPFISSSIEHKISIKDTVHTSTPKQHQHSKDAENIVSQNTELSNPKKNDWSHKENLDINSDINVKIQEYLKDLMKVAPDNVSMEPSFSFMVLVVIALKSSSQPSLPLHEIFQSIQDKFPYYQSGNQSWKNVVQRTIIQSDMFSKTCARSCNVKKTQDHGGCWTVDPLKAEGVLRRAVVVHSKKV